MNEQIHNQKPVNLPDDGNTPQEWHLHLRRGIVARRLQGRSRHRSLVVRMLVLLAAVLWVLFLLLVSR